MPGQVRLLIILETDFVNQRKLGFQPIDVLLFRFDDRLKQIAADEVADLLAMDDRRFQIERKR